MQVFQSNHDPLQLRRIEIILKTASRCNIACPGCYFFEGGDVSWKEHDKIIKPATVEAIARFLAEGLPRLKLETLQIDFHGGEPTMQKKSEFDAMCQTFREHLEGQVKLQLCMQSNGVLLDDEWIDLFVKHQVACSISLDGPPAYNDIARPDHRGRSTHARAVRGLRLLQQAHRDGRLPEPGLLCVINPDFDARTIHRHFIDELGVQRLDYLIPDIHYESPWQANPEKLGQFLVALFDEWVRDDNPTILVRLLRSFMVRLLGMNTHMFIDPNASPTNLAFTIGSNGHLAPDDALRPTGFWDPKSEPTVNETTLVAFLNSALFHQLHRLSRSVPTDCQGCLWENVCAGGHLYNRYSRERGFDNPSIWCNGLQAYYDHVVGYLLKTGVPAATLRAALLGGAAAPTEQPAAMVA